MDSSPSIPPTHSTLAKRPWYLTVSLIVSLLLGIGGWMSGWQLMQMVRAPSEYILDPNDFSLDKEADRLAMANASANYIHAVEAEHARTLPLAVLLFVFSFLMVLLTARVFGGRKGSALLLIQLLIARLVVVFCMNHFLPLQKTEERELWKTQFQIQTENKPSQAASFQTMSRHLPALENIAFALQTAVSLLIVFAIRKKGSMHYFEEMGVYLKKLSEFED